VRLIHCYGPTETTTFALCLTVRPEHLIGSSVPIGFPIAEGELSILDAELNPLSGGDIGELCIGGDGVARGYLNRPEATAESFIALERAGDPSIRLYRTGDLVRERKDGAIEFVGRIDDQVKISGYRVEPGEISSALREHAAVRDADVIARSDRGGEKRLVAYVAPRSKPAPAPSELRRFLAGKLPHFMLPTAFVTIDAIPLTTNGKVDRDALPSPLEMGADGDARPAQPTGGFEDKIAAVWSQVLGVARVGLHDSFFDLGGDSIGLIEVHSKLQKILGKSLRITDLFQYPTVAELAEHLDGKVIPGANDDIELRAQRQKELLDRRGRSIGTV
jgi:acyl carrier protein